MPPQELVILALTRMQSGVCLAGINQKTRSWVRPVLRAGTLSSQHVCDRNGKHIAPFDRITVDALEYHPSPPHIEDWVVDFVRQRPFIGPPVSPSQRLDLLESLLDPRPNDVFRQTAVRSLALVKPSSLTWVSFDPSNPNGNYEVRLVFEHPAGPPQPQAMTRPGIPLTDLKLRAWGREMLAGKARRQQLSEDDLRKRLGYEHVYLVIGRARPSNFDGQCWPMVVGFHTVPDYKAEIDWTNL